MMARNLKVGGRHDDTRDTHDANTIEFDVDNDFEDLDGDGFDEINTWRDPEIKQDD